MPTKTKITVTKDYPSLLGDYEGVGQRKIDLLHVHALAENFSLWKDKPLTIWSSKEGMFVVGGQHRMTALREFIFPALKSKKTDMDVIVYTEADAPKGMSVRDFLLLLIVSDNAGKENSPFDLAQLDHSKPWYALTKKYGIEFGSGGNAKSLQAEAIIRAVSIARNYLATGRFSSGPWLKTFETDTDEEEITKCIHYAMWWEEHVTIPASKVSHRNNVMKPTCLSLLLGIILDPANDMPSDPADLLKSRAKHKTLLGAPERLLSCNLYDRAKGNHCPTVWTNMLEPVNSAKQEAGRLLIGGKEKW